MAILIATVGVEDIVKTFLSMNPAIGLLAWLCLVLLFFLGGFNVWLLLNSIHAISFFDFLKVYTNSWVASLIVPGQAGDASIILFLKKRGIPLKITGPVYMLDKVITLAFFLTVSCYGSHLLIPDLKLSMFVLFLPPIGFAAFGLILWRLPSKYKLVAKTKARLEELWWVIRDFFYKKWYIIAINVLLTVIKWMVTSLGFYFAFAAFGFQVDIYVVTVIPILSSLVGYIPVSIAGLGTVEVTAAYLFSLVDIQQSIVLNSYLLLRVFQYGLAVLLLIISILFIKKKE